MANAATGAATIATLWATDVVSQQVAESLTSKTGVAEHVWMEFAEGSKSIKFGLSTAITASSFTDTTGMVLSTYDPDQVTVTAAPKGMTTRITDFGKELRPDTLIRVGTEHGKGIRVAVDTDVTALFPSFTASVNRPNAVLRLTDILSALGTLLAANVDADDIVAVVSASQYSDLLDDAQTSNPYAFQQAALTGKLPAPFGVPTLMSTTCTTANSAVDNVGAVFHRQAIGLGMVKGVSVEVSRAPAQYNATDIATSIIYGVGMTDDTRGVKLVSKAS